MEEKISNLDQKFDRVLDMVTVLKEENKQIHHKIIDLDTRVNSGRPGARAQRNVTDDLETDHDENFDQDEYNLGGRQCNPTQDYNGVQQDFRAIKDALQKIKLPSDLLVNDGRQGIQRKDQMRLNTVSACARYAETAIKLLSSLQPPNISPDDIGDLVRIMTAQIKFLQEEHNMMLVNGNFGEGVERIYRNFRRHTSQFTPDALTALQAVVNFNNHSQENQLQSYRSRGRGNSYKSSFYPRGRGNYFNSSSNQDKVPYGRSQDQHSGQDNQYNQ